MNISNWDNSILAPVIITYNRENCLKVTLQKFVEAGLTGIELVVLDNASNDNTIDVVAEYQKYWPNLKYHKNIYNIGGSGNILRAIEVTDSEYCWIIGDDDDWHLQFIDELIEVLSSQDADIIRLGWLVDDGNKGKYLPAMDLAHTEPLFFASISMISATIIRRSIASAHLPSAYMNIGDAYPQLVSTMLSMQEKPLTVYSTKNDLMTHTPNTAPGYYFGDLEWYAGWFRTSRFLRDRKLRIKFIGEITRYMTRDRSSKNSSLWLVKVALNYKAQGINQFNYLLSMMAYGEGWRGRMFMVSLAYCLMPGFLAGGLRRFYRKLFNLPERTLTIDRSRL
ncbi:glycosyltransferase family 2 protein [Methylomonas albis]|uniref:Glycosyltransferase family 2 protein n=1 Tax=Methylomonas albis TaxID=1854563 RepID=A0ABR9D0T6_9GAMM|nr:glycosyltransferase family 2 protein [Methylomonas albis]MBD9356713.1 glycosyltransferase family 2 protein [Methylomonas albis]